MPLPVVIKMHLTFTYIKLNQPFIRPFRPG